jgi:hypothetical protein
MLLIRVSKSPPGKSVPSDGSGKEGIAYKYRFLKGVRVGEFDVEANAAGGVAGGVKHLEGVGAKGDGIPVFQQPIRRR